MKSRARPQRAIVALVSVFYLMLPMTVMAQDSGTEERVRVLGAHTNVHLGPTTARPVLVLAPQDTELHVVGRRGEWIEVELPAELRETGMVMRWYHDEERGWVHQSTVEPVEDP